MSFECPICRDVFNKDNPEKIPKILKCGDTLCVKCLNKLMEKAKKICPICITEIKENIEDIRTNLFAYYIKNTIICPICLKEFEEYFSSEKAPKILKCGETFCFDCLKKNYKNEEIFCPICGKTNKEKLENIPVNKCAIELVEKEILNNVEYLNTETDTKIFDYEFSIGIMGNTNVGKTSLTHYFYKGAPLVNPNNTIGFEFHYKLLSIKKNKIKIRLWDTAGQETFRSYSMGLLRGVNAVLIIFSLTLPYSKELEKDSYNEWKNADKEKKAKIEEELRDEAFAQAKSWYNQFCQLSDESDKIIYLIGNKMDDVEHRIIKREDGIKLAKELNVPYFETSAITGENIYKIFTRLCLDLMKKIKKKRKFDRSIININEAEAYENTSRCC